MTKWTRMNFKTTISHNQRRFQCQPALVDKYRQSEQVQPVQFLCCRCPRCPFPDAQFYIRAQRPAPNSDMSPKIQPVAEKGEDGHWWNSSKWSLDVFRGIVFLTGLRFMYANQACHFSTNQVHVGRVLAERNQLNKSSLEIWVCILFYYFISNPWFFSCHLK